MKRILLQIIIICLLADCFLAQAEPVGVQTLSPKITIKDLNLAGFNNSLLKFMSSEFELTSKDMFVRLQKANKITAPANSDQAVFVWPGKVLDVQDFDEISNISLPQGIEKELGFDADSLIGKSFAELLLNASRGRNGKKDISWKERLYLHASSNKTIKYLLQFTIVQSNISAQEWQTIKSNEKKHYKNLSDNTKENYLTDITKRVASGDASEDGGYGLAVISALGQSLPTYLEYKKLNNGTLATNITVQIDEEMLRKIVSKGLFTQAIKAKEGQSVSSSAQSGVLQEGISLVDKNMLAGNSEKVLNRLNFLEAKSIPKKYRWNEKKIQQVLQDDNYLKFILVEQGEITGYAIFSRPLNSLARIGVIDKGQGKGTELLNKVIYHLSQQGVGRFTVLPLSDAIRFYRAFAAKSSLVLLSPQSSWIVQYSIKNTVFLEQAI